MSTTVSDPTTRPEDERLPLGPTFAYGIQHILTMYGGVIAPPLIVGGAAGLSPAQQGLLVTAALFVSGLATILQSVGVPFFGSQLPLVQGISFASVSTMTAVATGSGGLPAVFGAIIVAGVVGLAISPFFSQVVRFFPPVVTGTIITVIGLALFPVAVRWAMGGNAKAPDYGSVANIGLAAATLLVILLLSRLVQGRSAACRSFWESSSAPCSRPSSARPTSRAWAPAHGRPSPHRSASASRCSSSARSSP